MKNALENIWIDVEECTINQVKIKLYIGDDYDFISSPQTMGESLDKKRVRKDK